MKRSALFSCVYIWGTTLALVCLGCQSAPTSENSIDNETESTGDQTTASASHEKEAASHQPSATDAANANSSTLSERLVEDRWVRTIAPVNLSQQSPQLRWRHPLIEPVQWQTPERMAQLRQALGSKNQSVVANAVIFAARAGAPSNGAPLSSQLAQIVGNSKLKLPQRCAAAESLGLLREKETATTIQALLDEYAQQQQSAGYVVDLHVDLLHALAWHVPPSGDRRFGAALQSKSAEVRIAALEGWTINADDELPEAVAELRQDPDPRVRSAALLSLAVHRHPQAHEYLSLAIEDRDFSVRMAAIAALGRLGGEEARSTLEHMKNHPSEIARSAVVAALATAGADDQVVSAALDKSSRVRQAVAQVLAGAPRDSKAVRQESIALAHRLLHDASAEVQARAVESLEAWPLEVAGAVLLAALEQPTFRTRQAAARQLGRRWPPAAAFPVDSLLEKRQPALDELRNKWTTEFGSIQDQAIAAVKNQVEERINISPEKLAEVSRLLARFAESNPRSRQEAIAGLALLGKDILPVLDAMAADGKAAFPAELFTDVLPRLNPVFENLDRLSSSDVTARRLAAAAILAQLAGRPLSPLELRRLAELMSTEIDPVVWQQALRIVKEDGREAAQRVAQLAVDHASADVRRQACEYLLQHADPRNARFLAPLLKDPNSSVVVAAVRAIAAGRLIDDPRPLVELLVTPDKLLRAEVALALARLQIAEGAAALERLALETDLQVRTRIAAGLGELGDAAYVPVLIAMLEDRADVQRAAVRSLQQIIGADAGTVDSTKPETLDQQVRRWRQWHRDRQAAQAGG